VDWYQPLERQVCLLVAPVLYVQGNWTSTTGV
jgi:hypothetical protein